jgi:hypothetical protein
VGDGMVDAKFVTKEELLGLNMSSDESPITQYVDQIWGLVEKEGVNL